MAMTVKLSNNIISDAKIGKIAEENPDLTYELIKNILVAQQEACAKKLESYTFSKK